eukprot:CAMPEP_0183314578 /NCGR_PEP_ID=MMETSP0160_2-20130417/48899_1 /TAXON_ID=2839 ORGANISM="Odontella Sinensis, Strain Grunow 1884" /NCGR_SAMPLE_ID=MMETSP0160_2 /ASSEMBLY_ACC=CAM_ASM_000250 /LENGTH=188 /DNA_ID=CAMNT_0025479949 /DNA_START=201 /DNA_END=767 /DNA_ORIENTATION=+
MGADVHRRLPLGRPESSPAHQNDARKHEGSVFSKLPLRPQFFSDRPNRAQSRRIIDNNSKQAEEEEHEQEKAQSSDEASPTGRSSPAVACPTYSRTASEMSLELATLQDRIRLHDHFTWRMYSRITHARQTKPGYQTPKKHTHSMEKTRGCFLKHGDWDDSHQPQQAPVETDCGFDANKDGVFLLDMD